MNTADFLSQVYESQDAGFLIFDFIDRLLCDGNFEQVEEIFVQVDISKLSSSLRRSFLCISSPAKDKIPSRAIFFDKAFEMLTKEKSLQYAEKVLGRLK